MVQRTMELKSLRKNIWPRVGGGFAGGAATGFGVSAMWVSKIENCHDVSRSKVVELISKPFLKGCVRVNCFGEELVTVG